MTIEITGSGLTIEKVVDVARNRVHVELNKDAFSRIVACRAMLERKIEAHEIMYGVNTGIGEFSEVVLDDDQVKDFQKYLIYNHAAGIGEAMNEEYVRGAMLGRINVHAHGNSGIRPEITMTLIEMLNKGVTPYVCQKGSVGASGDLAPMSQIALLLMGEGKAFYKGELLEGKEAMDRAEIKIPGLQARDGLGTINGSNVLTAMSAIFLFDANNWLKQAEIAAAMSLEALKANMGPYTAKLHEARGFKGAIRSACAIGRLVANGDLKTGKVDHKVQDAYSMRYSPQVIGAAHDALAYARTQVEIELNGVGDNPIFFPEEDLQLYPSDIKPGEAQGKDPKQPPGPGDPLHMDGKLGKGTEGQGQVMPGQSQGSNLDKPPNPGDPVLNKGNKESGQTMPGESQGKDPKQPPGPGDPLHKDGKFEQNQTKNKNLDKIDARMFNPQPEPPRIEPAIRCPSPPRSRRRC